MNSAVLFGSPSYRRPLLAALARLKVDRIVSLWLNMACEFQRAGFLEGEAIETPLPIGPKTQW